MFYLKEFFKTIGESPIRGVFFILFSCLLALSLTHRSLVFKLVEKITPEKMVNPYFVTIIDGQSDIEKIKRFANSLPGVISIDENFNQRSQLKIKQLIDSLGKDYLLDNKILNFKSIRVELNSSLSVESFDFIREQIVKFGGSENLSSTEVKYPEVTGVMNNHPFYHFLKKAGDWGVIGFFSVLWIVSYWLCYDIFRGRSYIIEKFQRRKLVAAKTLGAGLGLIFSLFLFLGIWNGTLSFLNIIILIMIFSVFWSFSMQEWRWKQTL